MTFRARSPVRVDFAGAWSDCAPFANAFGGATLNAAITMYVEGALQAHEGEEFPIGEGAEARSGLAVTYSSQIPTGTGLGTSAALNVVWLALARRESVTSQADRERIAALAYDIEKVLGIIGGKQDQYASAIGGINLFEFTEEGVRCEPVRPGAPTIQGLRERLVLCYTGTARLSSNIHRNVWGAFRQGRKQTVDALFGLRRGAYEARDALLTGDLPALGAILTQQFEHSKRLDASTTNERLEALFEAALPFCHGGKPCGAGGGGCVLFLAREPDAGRGLRRLIEECGMTTIDFDFDFEGLQLWKQE